jgi:hypothetical protein
MNPDPNTPHDPPRFTSLSELVAGWIEAFESGAWTYVDGWRHAPGMTPQFERRMWGPAELRT